MEATTEAGSSCHHTAAQWGNQQHEAVGNSSRGTTVGGGVTLFGHVTWL